MLCSGRFILVESVEMLWRKCKYDPFFVGLTVLLKPSSGILWDRQVGISTFDSPTHFLEVYCTWSAQFYLFHSWGEVKTTGRLFLTCSPFPFQQGYPKISDWIGSSNQLFSKAAKRWRWERFMKWNVFNVQICFDIRMIGTYWL